MNQRSGFWYWVYCHLRLLKSQVLSGPDLGGKVMASGSGVGVNQRIKKKKVLGNTLDLS